MNNANFVKELAKLRPNSTFLTLKRYQNEHNEISDYSIIFHMSYKTALQKSLKIIEELSANTILEKQAKSELIESFSNSLTKHDVNELQAKEDGYSQFYDNKGNFVKGVKLHDRTSTLHLYGLVVHKKVVQEGEYPVRNSKELTIIKNKMRSLTPVGKFRQFKVLPSQVESITVENVDLLNNVE